MIRTALRLSTIAALQNGGHEPYPTLAGALIMDSMQGDITDIKAGNEYPMIIVRTDEDNKPVVDERGNNTLTRRIVTLRIELRVMHGVITRNSENEEENTLIWAETDAGLEALLDLMELQIENALFGSLPWGMWWKALWKFSGIPGRANVRSVPYWTDPNQGRIRLAVRELEIPISVPNDCIPFPKLDDGITPLPELSSQLLNVFTQIVEKGAGDIVIAASQLRDMLITHRLPSSTLYPPFSGTNMNINAFVDATTTHEVE